MSLVGEALSKLGISSDVSGSLGAALGLTRALDGFTVENALPGMNSEAGRTLRAAIETAIPPIFRNEPAPGGINATPTGGDWTSYHYADDLVGRQPKFKFLFKVKFSGSVTGVAGGELREFYYFVTRCDKPRVILEHADVNYYNFRTKVLTKTIFQPITMTLHDEIGNTVHDFFVQYLASVSGQGSAGWGIDSGFGAASSTKAYARAYSNIQSIELYQIFANGTYVNEFKFINPRIEAFDYDDLNMEDSVTGSSMTLTFHYDALSCKTYESGPATILPAWGNTDIWAGGGASGRANAGSETTSASGKRSGGGSGAQGITTIIKQPAPFYAATQLQEKVGESIKDLVSPITQGVASAKNFVSSASDTVSRGIADTLQAIRSGSNIGTPAARQDENYSNEGRNYPAPDYSNEGRNSIAPDYSNEGRNKPTFKSGGGGDFGGGGASGSWP